LAETEYEFLESFLYKNILCGPNNNNNNNNPCKVASKSGNRPILFLL